MLTATAMNAERLDDTDWWGSPTSRERSGADADVY